MANKNNSGSGSSMGKLAFYTICAIAVLYLVTLILHFVSVESSIVGWLQAVCALISFVIVAIVGWKYVAKRATVYKVLYFVCLVIVVACILLPKVL